MDKTDIELVENVKNGDEDSLVELANRHRPLCIDICKKYIPSVQASGTISQDVYSDIDYLIYLSAQNYDNTKKTKFSTWLGHQTRYACLKMNKKNQSLIYNQNLEEAEQHNEKNLQIYNKFIEPTDSIDYMLSILSHLKDDRIFKIFEIIYKSDKRPSLKEIGKQIGCSYEWVRILHKRGLKFLKNNLKASNEQ